MNIAFIGLGAVGMYYSEGLVANGATVKGYDVMVGDPRFEERVRTVRGNGVKVVNSMEELVKDANLIMVVTTAAVAVKTAESAKPFLKKGQIYVELNSAVPSDKKRIEESLREVGVDVVDGTTMSAVNMVKYKAQINFSGPRAKDVVDILRGYKMDARYFGEEVGQAAAFKLVRSIFMKGYEAILMECAEAAAHYGVLDDVLKSIAEYFDAKTSQEHFDLFINTDAVFAKRRSEEVAGVIKMLADDGINNTMTRATVEKLSWISTLGLDEHYNHEAPNDKHDVIRRLCAAEKDMPL